MFDGNVGSRLLDFIEIVGAILFCRERNGALVNKGNLRTGTEN